jgi:hypothetical protein
VSLVRFAVQEKYSQCRLSVGQSLYQGTHACRHRKQSEVGYGSNREEESKVESAKDSEEDLLDLAAEGTKALS